MSAELIVFFCGLGAVMLVAAVELLGIALLGTLERRVPKGRMKRLVRWFGG